MKTLLLILLLLLSAVSFAQNYGIGHTTILFEDPERNNREIETEIYYPATNTGENAPPESGQFPVIVFGHGFVMAWSAYENLWDEFVPRGYIMAFPRTEGNAFSTDHQEFGWDLEFLVGAMQQQGMDQNSILYNAVAAETALMGHSMGGGAAFLAADSLCSNGNPYLKTLIGLAPAESTSNGVSSISTAANVTVPSFILSGIQDGVTPPVDHHIPMYNNLASDCKTILNIIGGAHCYFANSNFNCDFGESTSSSGISISRAEQHDITFDFVNLWLDYTLKANCNDFTVFNDSLNTTSRATFDQLCAGPIDFESFETAQICQGDTYTFPDGSTGSSSTTHVSQLTTAGGCDSLVETTLNVVSSFNINESVSICSGDTYIFPDGMSGSNNMTHTSSLTSSSGCDSIIVTVLTLETIDTNVSNVNGVLSANLSGASYQWIDCSTLSPINGETSQSYEPTNSGIFGVQITLNGCTENSGCHEIQTTSIEDEELSSSFVNLFPNPTNGLITVDVPDRSHFILYNMQGKAISKFKLKPGTQDLLLNLSSGVFVWEVIRSTGAVEHGKLVIE